MYPSYIYVGALFGGILGDTEGLILGACIGYRAKVMIHDYHKCQIKQNRFSISCLNCFLV